MHEIPPFIGAAAGLSLAAAVLIGCSVGLIIACMYAIEFVLRVGAAIISRIRRRRP